MCIMEKDKKKKFDNDILSNSYRDGIERVLGVKGHVTYELPPDTIKRRQIFWDNFFLEYSEQLSDDTELDVRTLKLCSSKYKSAAVCKSKSIVQYWVNTGYLPYQMSIHKIGHLENNHFSMEGELNISYTKLHDNESSLSSSVDTAAYILSNINTTNKADTMAIVEGAKHDNLENFCDTTHCENTKLTKIVDDVMHENNAENNIRDNNNSISQQHSPVTSEIMTCTVPQQNIDAQRHVDTLGQTLNTKSPSTDSCKSYSYKLLNNVSTSVHSKESCLKQSLLDCSAIKRHRKRLYSGRNSPVDLTTMEHSHKKVLSKLTRHIHPALDFKYPFQKKIKVRKKRSFKCCMINKSLMNSTLSTSDSKKFDEVENSKNYSNRLSARLNDLEKLDDTSCTNREILINANNIQDLNKCNENQSVNISLSSEFVSTNQKRDYKNKELNNTIIQSEKINTRASDKLNNTSKQLTNSNSMIGKVNSRKCKKKSNKVMKDPKNLNPIVVLTRLSNLDIQKYKKIKNNLHNLHPQLCLKKLSASEIQKYKRRTNMMKDAKYLNVIVRLEKLSEATIKKYKTALHTKTHSKTDLLSDTVQLSDNSVNRSQLSLRNKANGLKSPLNIINVGGSDTDSNQSTLLVYECNTNTSDNVSLSNVSESSKKLAEFSSPVFETCNNSSRLKLRKINKNLTLENDIIDKQSVDNTLNTSINSQKHISNIYIKTSINGHSDNIHTTIDKKKNPHLNGLVNPKHSRRSGEKLNVMKKQSENEYNNLIEEAFCNTKAIEKNKSEKQAVVKGLIEALYNGKTKKNKNKFNTNYLHFETKLYDSDSELTSDSELLSYLSN